MNVNEIYSRSLIEILRYNMFFNIVFAGVRFLTLHTTGTYSKLDYILFKLNLQAEVSKQERLKIPLIISISFFELQKRRCNVF